MIVAGLAFVIILAVITVTIILVVRELNKIEKQLSIEEQLSRLNETTMGSNMDNVVSVMSRRIMSESSALKNIMSSSNADVVSRIQALDGTTNTSLSNLSKELLLKAPMSSVTQEVTALNTGLQDFQSKVSAFQAVSASNLADVHTNIEMLKGNDLSFSSNLRQLEHPNSISVFNTDSSNYGKLTFDSLSGISFSNNNPMSKYDLNAPRATVSTSLNVAGTLNFASQNSSYMLGVDANDKALYVQMPKPNHKFKITDDKAQSRFAVSSKGVAVASNLFVANPTTNNAYSFEMRGQDMNVKPVSTTGAFYVRDGNNNERLSVLGDGVKLQGQTTATGSLNVSGTTKSAGGLVSNTTLCINNVCVDEAELTTVQTMAKAYKNYLDSQ